MNFKDNNGQCKNCGAKMINNPLVSNSKICSEESNSYFEKYWKEWSPPDHDVQYTNSLHWLRQEYQRSVP